MARLSMLPSGRPGPGRVIESVVLTALRVALGVLLVYAGAMKIDDPNAFALSIRAYGLVDGPNRDFTLSLLAFTIPWTEVLGGAALILGAWGRGAGLMIAAQLGVFTLANYLVLDDNVKCSCFGDKDPFCKEATIGLCQMVRNGSMIAVALLLAWRGAGLWSVDTALSRLRAAALAGAEPGDRGLDADRDRA